MNDAYSDDIVIDLIDMLFYFLKKWRSLLAALLVFSVLGGLWAIKPTAELEEADIKEPVLANMEKAQEYRNLYSQQKQYNEESLLMQMDANGLYQSVLSYHVSAEKELNLVRAEYGALLDDEINLILKDVSGYKAPLKYIDELTAVSTDIVTDERGDNSSASLNVTYSITCDSEEKCIAMHDALRNQVVELQKELSRRYADHTAVKITDMVSQISENWYIQNQENNNKKMNEYLDNALKLETALSEEESRYYASHYLKVEEEAPGLGYYAKKIIVAAFLGCVLWGVWYLVKYFADRSIKTVEEALNISHLFLLGRVKSEKNLKGIDKWLDGIQEKTRYKLDETSYVAAVVDSKKAGEAVLCGNREAEEVCRIMGELAQGCAGLIPCDFTFQNAQALKMAKEIGQMVMVVRTGKTKKSEILREMELCKMQGVNILGIVVAD